jgi:hypothetical protein
MLIKYVLKTVGYTHVLTLIFFPKVSPQGDDN